MIEWTLTNLAAGKEIMRAQVSGSLQRPATVANVTEILHGLFGQGDPDERGFTFSLPDGTMFAVAISEVAN